jgi:hypothetical protein
LTDASPQAAAVLAEIDAAVFDLFEVSNAERSLVNDFHQYVLGFAGGGANEFGSARVAKPIRRYGSARDVDLIGVEPLHRYVREFLRIWNSRLAPSGELAWRLVMAPRSHVVAAVFETFADELPDDLSESYSWDELLVRISASLGTRLSESLSTESAVRVVTDTSIVIIKRDHPRFWSSSAAAEDAEATLLQAMNLQA